MYGIVTCIHVLLALYIIVCSCTSLSNLLTVYSTVILIVASSQGSDKPVTLSSSTQTSTTGKTVSYIIIVLCFLAYFYTS